MGQLFSEKGKKVRPESSGSFIFGLYTVMEVWKTLRILTTGICPLCGATVLPAGTRGGLCIPCVRDLVDAPGPFFLEEVPGTVATRMYGGSMKRAIEALKIAGRKDMAVPLAEILLLPQCSAILREWVGSESIYLPLVPVPGSREGCRTRGFDTAALLARRLQLPVLPLVRRRWGRMQKTLNRDDRIANAREQYHAAATLPGSCGQWRESPPERVLIVDDVVTTGASILRCGEILQDLGVREWRALVLAARL